MSTLRTINVIHPSGSTTNIVNDNAGNVAVGGTLTASTITSATSTALTIQSAGTTAMTVSTGQNVGIGTTSPSFRVTANYTAPSTFTNASGDFLQMWQNGGTNALGVAIETTAAVARFVNNNGYITAFNYAGTAEAMRIDTSGNLLVGTTTSSAKLSVAASSGTNAIVYANNTTGSGNQGAFSAQLGSSANNTSSYHFAGTTGASSWYLLGNGTTSYTSDARLKKNITTTRDGYLEDICKLRVVKYQWSVNEDNSPVELGLIAQEVETVFPGLVQDALFPSDDGITYKTIKGSVLTYMLIKTVQELSAKNDALEASNAAFERRLAALENK